MKIDLDQIRDLLAVVSATDVTELTIEFGDQRITVKQASNALQAITAEVPMMPSTMSAIGTKSAQPMSFEPKSQESARQEKSSDMSGGGANNGLIPVTSPMVGTFYRSPSPSAAPFVNVGDHINVGQTVCIIEAMKLMNDMPAEVSGKIVKICVDNGTTVEYGQQLFLVDPKG